MSDKKSNTNFLMQGGILAIAGLITRFIGMLYRIPLTRIVGTEGMTYYNNAYEIYNITLLISTYSIPVAVSKLISAKDSKGEYINSNRIFRVGLLISSGIGFLASLLLILFSDTLAAAMNWPSAAIPLRYLAPTIFVFSIMGMIRGLFQGKKTNVPTALSQIIEQVFNAIFSIVAALLLIRATRDTGKNIAAYGAAGGTLGTLIGAVFGLIFLVFVYYINRDYFTRKCIQDKTGVVDSDLQIARSIILTMLPIVLSQTIYQLSGMVDSYMFGTIMEGKGLDEAARAVLYEPYTNKYKWLYNLPVAIASSFGVTIVPTLAGSFANEDMETVKSRVSSAIKLNMLIAIPSSVGLMVLGGPILLMLFGNSSDVLSGQLMKLGGIAVVFFALSTFTNGVLQGINHLRLPVIHSAISLAVHILIVYLLVGVFNFGIYGMVIGNVTYGLLVSILNWISIGDLLDYKQEIKTTFIIPAIASIIMGIICFAIYKLVYLIVPSNTVATLFALIIAVFAYFILLILLKGITVEEMKGFPKGEVLIRLASKLHLIR